MSSNEQPFATSAAYQQCPSCATHLPSEMRFCRNCGYRLGGGVADDTETRRFAEPSAATTAETFTTTATRPLTPPLFVNHTPPAGPMMPFTSSVPPSAAQAGGAQTAPMTPPNVTAIPAMTYTPAPASACSTGARRGPHWLVWVIVGVVASGAFGGMIKKSVSRNNGGAVSRQAAMPRSFAGVDDVDDAGNKSGAKLGFITPPGSPADQAGLTGGDVITALDGQRVTDEDSFITVLRATPVGKTVEVVYLRDGAERKTQLTTVSEGEIDRLKGAYRKTPHGFLGVDGLEQVTVPGLNIVGVQVGDIVDNSPAYLQGLQENDIIIELNGAPIRTTQELKMRIERMTPLSVGNVVVMRGLKDGKLEQITLPIKFGKD